MDVRKPDRRMKMLAVPVRWSYTMLATHLGVSKRTLIRWVVAGMIPPPYMDGSKAFWEGEILKAAKEGRKIPGSFDYVAPARERKRIGTIAAKAKREKQATITNKRRARKHAKEATVQA